MPRLKKNVVPTECKATNECCLLHPNSKLFNTLHGMNSKLLIQSASAYGLGYDNYLLYIHFTFLKIYQYKWKSTSIEEKPYRYFSDLDIQCVFIFDYHLKSTTKLISFRERTKNQKIMAFIIYIYRWNQTFVH